MGAGVEGTAPRGRRTAALVLSQEAQNCSLHLCFSRGVAEAVPSALTKEKRTVFPLIHNSHHFSPLTPPK